MKDNVFFDFVKTYYDDIVEFFQSLVDLIKALFAKEEPAE